LANLRLLFRRGYTCKSAIGLGQNWAITAAEHTSYQ